MTDRSVSVAGSHQRLRRQVRGDKDGDIREKDESNGDRPGSVPGPVRDNRGRVQVHHVRLGWQTSSIGTESPRGRRCCWATGRRRSNRGATTARASRPLRGGLGPITANSQPLPALISKMGVLSWLQEFPGHHAMMQVHNYSTPILRVGNLKDHPALN